MIISKQTILANVTYTITIEQFYLCVISLSLAINLYLYSCRFLHGIRAISIEDAPRTIKERDEMLNVPYKQILGCIRYLVSCTRPDLCFTAGILSRFMQDPGPKHWQALKRLLRYLKRTKDMVLIYSRSQSESINMNLEGWTNPSQLSGWTDSD